MQLKFSHVDVLVNNLEEACAYYAKILKARISRTLVWERGGLHVRRSERPVAEVIEEIAEHVLPKFH